jgi:hypothetical protein
MRAIQLTAFGNPLTNLRRADLPEAVAATYPMARIADAIAHAQRGGKVLLDLQDQTL